jgi:hypothetical protein
MDESPELFDAEGRDYGAIFRQGLRPDFGTANGFTIGAAENESARLGRRPLHE